MKKILIYRTEVGFKQWYGKSNDKIQVASLYAN
jgi:hypothetical protein